MRQLIAERGADLPEILKVPAAFVALPNMLLDVSRIERT
jgi:hypothetical protein